MRTAPRVAAVAVFPKFDADIAGGLQTTFTASLTVLPEAARTPFRTHMGRVTKPTDASRAPFAHLRDTARAGGLVAGSSPGPGDRSPEGSSGTSRRAKGSAASIPLPPSREFLVRVHETDFLLGRDTKMLARSPSPMFLPPGICWRGATSPGPAGDASSRPRIRCWSRSPSGRMPCRARGAGARRRAGVTSRRRRSRTCRERRREQCAVPSQCCCRRASASTWSLVLRLSSSRSRRRCRWR